MQVHHAALSRRAAPQRPAVGIVPFRMRSGRRVGNLGRMRAMAVLVLGLVATGCGKTYIVAPDGGVVAECGPGYTICEPAAALDGGEAEYPLVCSDLQIDSHNCGACGNEACIQRGCIDGKCGPCRARLDPCASAADCCSGKCSAPSGHVGECE